MIKNGGIPVSNKSTRDNQIIESISSPKQNKGLRRTDSLGMKQTDSFSNALTSFALQQQQNQAGDLKKSNFS